MKISLVLMLFLALTACIQLGGDVKPQHYYLLSPLAEANSDAETSHNLIFSRVEFPTYLDRPQIVTRSLQDELQISNNDRWGEPLQDNLVRVLKENLQRRLNGLRISSFPWQPVADNGLRLKMIINQFDGTLGQQTNVDLRWALTETASKQVLVQKHFINHQPIGSNPADLVAGLSRAVNQLSEEISQEIMRIK